MMKKIAEINPKGVSAMTVYYDSKAETNPYRVYYEWYAPSPEGLRKRTKQIARYSDLYSCARLMADYVGQNNEERR